jgi:hypothetical protein
MEWIKTSDRLPNIDKGDCNWPHVFCLVYREGEGILVRPYNVYHKCWDDEECDDHFKDTEYFTHWSLVPACPRK